jgi:hypothetical protein
MVAEGSVFSSSYASHSFPFFVFSSAETRFFFYDKAYFRSEETRAEPKKPHKSA